MPEISGALKPRWFHTETAQPDHMLQALEPATWSDERFHDRVLKMTLQLPGTSTTRNRASLFIMRS